MHRLKEFMEEAEKPYGIEVNRDELRFCWDLIEEEYTELYVALEDLESSYESPKLKQEVLKEMCDVVYVIKYMCATFGWDFEEAFDRVHQSNMSKFPCTYDANGKVQKGPNYEPPQLEDCIS